MPPNPGLAQSYYKYSEDDEKDYLKQDKGHRIEYLLHEPKKIYLKVELI